MERFPGLPKSAMFITMGYSPVFLLKNGEFLILFNSVQSLFKATTACGEISHEYFSAGANLARGLCLTK